MGQDDIIFEEGGIFTLILSIICFTLMMIMYIHFIRHQWCKNRKQANNEDKIHSIVALFALTFFILYTLQNIMFSSYWLIHANDNNFNPKWCIAFYFHHNYYFIGKIGMYSFWFVR